MNKFITRSFRISVIASGLALPLFCGAAEKAPADRAAVLLAQNGRVEINAVGAHVERGTYRVQVAAKLGTPDLTLPDGTWLYHGRRIQGSDARGSVVVSFERGRVSSLALVTPAVVVALQTGRGTTSDAGVLASR